MLGTVETVSHTPAAQRTVGILLGVVLLGVIVALGVGLPQARSADSLSLPERIDGPLELVATDVVDEADTDEESAERQGELFTSASDRIEEVFDAEAVVRFYSDADRQTQVAVTVVDAPAGPYLPTGPPADPELLGLERNTNELVVVDDAVCEQYWPQPIGAGEQVPEGDPSFLRCQLPVAERTWLIEGVGLDAQQAVDILHDLAG